MNIPKVAKTVEVNKTPKSLKDPDIYKDIPISWQLNRIDDGSRWGISVFRKKIKLVNNEKLFDGFKDIKDEIGLPLIDMMGKEFDSIESFLEKVHKEANGPISINELKVILGAIDENIFWKDIYPTLIHFEKKTWFEIEQETYYGRGRNKTKHHSIKIAEITSEAKSRLEDLKIEDIDELFSIRLSGKIRIWGIRKQSHFQILWFDLKHEICPSLKS